MVKRLLAVLCIVPLLMGVDAPPAFRTFSGYFDGVPTAANSTVAVMQLSGPVTSTRIAMGITVAGTGVGNFVYRVQNTTAVSTICTRTMACTAVVGPNSASCTAQGGALGDNVEIQVDASACTTSPSGTITWTFY